MKENLIDVESKHLAILKKILKQHVPSKTVWAYGSRVTWTAGAKSDLDIVVFDADSKQINDLKDEFAESDLPFSVDVMDWGKIPEKFKENIREKYVVLQEKVGLEGWRECKLGEISSKIGSGATPTGGEQSYKKDGIALIRSQNIYDFNFSSEGLAYIDEKQAYDLRNVEVVQNDILINITGESVTRSCIVPKQYLPARVNQHVSIIRPLKEKADFQFVFYYLQSIKPELNSMAEIGCTRRALTKDMLENIDIPLPSLFEQRTIASVLSGLDDKIDFLNKQNKTLEAMAETLFRQWFVVEVNDEWGEKPLSSIANFLNGLACQKYPPINEIEKLPVLKIKELGSGISESSDWATSNINEEYIVNAGDVIFAWSASLMVKIWDGEKCVLNQHLFKVTSEDFPKWFYYRWCKHHLAEFISISSSHATTMGHIKRGDLDTAMVIVPTEADLNNMSEQMTPLLEKQIFNARQIRVLEKLRYILLPKLMSGEVRVSI